jgi:hypothetical protein
MDFEVLAPQICERFTRRLHVAVHCIRLLGGGEHVLGSGHEKAMSNMH